jgi:predicted DNA-binding protein with PD1-like motif
MRERLLADGDGARSFVLVADRGCEFVAAIESWAAKRGVRAGRVSAIGAFERAVIGWFDWRRKDYRRVVVGEQAEVVSLLGDLALTDDAVTLHAHVVLGSADGSALAGHLLEGIVRPTLEVMVVEAPAHLERHFDPETGLALLQP